LDVHPSQPITCEPFIEGFPTFDPRKVYHRLCAVNKLAFPSRKRKKKKQFKFNSDTHVGKFKPQISRQRALIAAANLTEQDVSSTASVYQARNNPELPMLIPQVRPAHKYPNSPWEMIHPPEGDNAVCR
jgi:hypothetical protein